MQDREAVLRGTFAAMLAMLASAAALLTPHQQLSAAKVIDPRTNALVSPLDGVSGRSLVVLLPQLGEFDSSELCEALVAVQEDLKKAELELRVIGIGDAGAAKRFGDFTGLPLDCLRVDPDASLHRALSLHAGPDWSVPDSVPDAVLSFLLSTLPGGAPPDEAQLRPVFNAWLNYIAMCAGLGAPGTLPEIIRGYLGDQSAPERLASDAVVKAGPVVIGPGVGPVKTGPISYELWWGDESGYQRPVELATVRLRNMVEVLTHWEKYVSNPLRIAQRGATYIFGADGETLHEYRSRGVLTYSETMPRPLTFLEPYIGQERSRNPLGLGDASPAAKRGRGWLKPAGRAMGLLGPIFKLENDLQANALGVDDAARAEAREEIERAIKSNGVVVYTYGLSPFSSEALALLDAAGTKYENVPLGPEWFLLGKRGSALRAELLAMTGQSSLPHVFIGGEHVGGLHTGTASGGFGEKTLAGAGGLASLQEAGQLDAMLEAAERRVQP